MQHLTVYHILIDARATDSDSTSLEYVVQLSTGKRVRYGYLRQSILTLLFSNSIHLKGQHRLRRQWPTVSL